MRGVVVPYFYGYINSYWVIQVISLPGYLQVNGTRTIVGPCACQWNNLDTIKKFPRGDDTRIFQDNLNNTTATDALAPCTTNPSTTMLLALIRTSTTCAITMHLNGRKRKYSIFTTTSHHPRRSLEMISQTVYAILLEISVQNCDLIGA